MSTNSSPIIPVKIYSNANTQKENIIKENKNKSGILLHSILLILI
jgi:hypothetical protein